MLGKEMSKAEVRAAYRNNFKGSLISAIYAAGDFVLKNFMKCQMHEVPKIKQAIFGNFKRLYEWQQEQLLWNKMNSGYIKTFLGDIRKSYDDAKKQSKQAVKFAA